MIGCWLLWTLCRVFVTSSTQASSVFVLDKVVAKVTEDVYEHSHIIEGLIDEANIRISALKTELENMKKPATIVNLRTGTVHAVLVFLSFFADGRGTHHTW